MLEVATGRRALNVTLNRRVAYIVRDREVVYKLSAGYVACVAKGKQVAYVIEEKVDSL